MSYAQQMIQTHPSGAALDQNTLVECIGACFDCAQASTACADACIAEGDIGMLGRCIRLDLDCADICDTTGRILSRQIAFDQSMVRAVVEACGQACRLCAEECEKHAEHHEHCRVCADACRRSEQACNDVLSALAA